ncbi:SGNH/GDSL hydrolase family protein [Natrinema salifodinae]|uniref:Lysophospholipase L1 n=1 Tax=Natrinema salifodinae TaxID=1202768 RepID=A0A1I0QX51_9EURY|nr:SGNH/GDSL hydrolase family protein [Natrinema salifodinae]SEW31599.1 Lysophospholipase L1 [Natrinema salifodinae]
MTGLTRRTAVKAVGGLVGLGTASSAVGSVNDDTNRSTETDPSRRTRGSPFLGAWTASPQAPLSDGISATGFEDQTLRQMVRPSVGGRGVRLKLTNAFGDESITFDRASVGRRVSGSGASVEPGTLRQVTFGDDPDVTIPPGARVMSDPVELRVGAGQDLVVSLYTETATGPTTWHQLPTKTSYVSSAGDRTADPSGDAFPSSVTHWFFLGGIEVLAPEHTGAIACFGDSITDGHGSTLDANAAYPDFLAERVTERQGLRKSVVNAGISGNRVLSDSDVFGPNALARFDRDVLTQTGVTDVVLLEGINDIGFERFDDPKYRPATSVTADDIIAGYEQLIRRAHARGVRIIGGTLTPFEGAVYYYEAGERKRQAINEFIRTSGAFDGVVDFDKAVRDPDDPKCLRPEYDSGDTIHPNDAGYRAMADAVDLSLFRGHRSSKPTDGESTATFA